MKYDPANASNAWDLSNLRSWMNSSGGANNAGDTTGFYNSAFTAAEKAKIVVTNVNMHSTGSFIAYNRLLTADWWKTYSTVAGSDTQDNVWVLSGEELFSYFGKSLIATQAELGHDPANYTNAYLKPTDYAYSIGVKVNTGDNGASFIGFGDVWTRSPGAEFSDGLYHGVFLGSTGSLNSGREVARAYGALPVVTVALK